MKLPSFLALSRVSNLCPHPDGKRVAVALQRPNADGSAFKPELWEVPLGGDAEPRKLATKVSQPSEPAYDASGTLYALCKPKATDGEAKSFSQVWRFDDNGEPHQLTSEPLGVCAFHVAAKTLVVTTPVLPGVPHEEQRARHDELEAHGPSGRHYHSMPIRSWDRWTGEPWPHFVVFDLGEDAASNRRDRTPEFTRELDAPHGAEWDLSADGKTIAAVCEYVNADRLDASYLVLIDVESGAQRQVGREPSLHHGTPVFSPDGKTVACVRETRRAGRSDASHLLLCDVATGETRGLATHWDSQPSVEAFGDKSLFVCAPEAGRAQVYSVCLRTEAHTQLSQSGTHCSLHRVASGGNEVLVGLRSEFFSPPEVFSIGLEADGAAPTVHTRLSGAPQFPELLAESHTVRGAGDEDVQYFVLRNQAANQAKQPALLWIHGGPVHSWTDGWHWRWNPLPFLDAGFSVVLPNPRGSTGFGRAFVDGIVGNTWGDACYRDIMAVTDAICARSDIDESRLVAMGGSFGGYMCNWLGAKSDRFAAIVSHAGVYRMSAFHGTTDWPEYWAHQMGEYPDDAAGSFDRYSPHRYVSNWTTPVLITHGEKDYRVPVSESLMLFEDVQRHGVPSELLVFPDENHWIQKPRNIAQWYQSCLDFALRHTQR